MSSNPICLGYATFPDRATALRICEVLVTEHTVACANLQPVHESIYIWAGALRYSEEIGVWFKLSRRKRPILKARLSALHPFAVPALVFVDVTDGLPDFLNWVANQSL